MTPLSPGSVGLRLPTIGLQPYRELPDGLRPAAAMIRKEAEHAVAHRVDLLGSVSSSSAR